ncbi:MAG: T9SS type A sorting domain-containing protein [Ferruginibacter sp.]
MKKILLIITAVALLQLTRGQGFSKAEYFFDTDPGITNGTAIPLTGIADTVNFNAVVSTASLSPGFHFLGLRVRHNNNSWGLLENRGFYISSNSIAAADISAAEYFFDADPGTGNGSPLNIGTPGAIVNFTAIIPASLPGGFHFLAVRTKSTDGNWSLFEERGFYISTSSADVAGILAAEYFFDADPGPGNGSTAAIGTSGPVVNFSAAIPASLATGFHFLAIRTKDANGKWSLFETRGFYISASASNTANITAAEYFFDTDPGSGNGSTAAIGTSGPVVNFTVIIPALLSNGFHFLSIRTKDANGIWGLYEQRGFYISSAIADMPQITAAEYFFDTDPGVGNGTSLTVSSPGNTVTQLFNVPVPAAMAAGQHFLAIRVKDQNNNWGLYDFDTLNISGAVPVTGLFFTATKENKQVKLDWFTLTELNTDRFEIERSRNGIDFEKIALLNAAGNSFIRKDYHFTDIQPLPDFNYYRLKQFDKDGKFIYSPIRLIRMNEQKLFSVYPTISSNYFMLNSAVENINIQLFSSSKQLIKSWNSNTASVKIDASALPSGAYWIIVEKDNRIIFYQQVIKR